MFGRKQLEILMEELAGAEAEAYRLANGAKHEQAWQPIEDAYPKAGIPALALDRLDQGTIRMMVGDKVPALLLLLDADAKVSELVGDQARAKRRRALAAALRV